MIEMDVNRQARYQALRLQRFYLAQLIYGISYLIIAVTWATGSYTGSNAMAMSHYLLGFGSQAVFFVMFKTGFNLRFKDPSLTSAQIIVALLLQTYLLAFAGPVRSTILVAYCLILLFGVFQLSRIAYLAHAAFALVCYGSLVVINMHFELYPQTLSIALLEWFVLACFMLWLTILGSYIRELRERLQQRHTTLQQHQQSLRGMMEQLQNLASTDTLTGLPNRRYFLDEVHRRMALLGNGQTLGLALIDLDHFKRINDLYGHSAGDDVLQSFACIARTNLRGDDMVARFGGEEFVVLLGNCDLATLQHCVERIRMNFANTHHPSLPESAHCTMSAGLCLIHPEDSLEVRISQADEALYRAKAGGRNCSRIHEDVYA
ncbi:diguanylate cyclase (GGDEF) domain-containing protein [Halopseudomonas litoralis]|uniref:diguanylate cyclase n=1 Tax=Halopseudomonas litoralis TaxID=797277 RepID=A0A1H1N8G9_9GAMM|nr:GGDEF domain-containing protein [Halopseudomonas litoralis]SDR95296.1 diguanylate cyclase (GGDEF) domain-containing protein [Halopseudomonas litoralis]